MLTRTMESFENQSESQQTNEPTTTEEEPTNQKVDLPLSRRTALASLLGLGGLGLMSNSVQAEHKGVHWNKHVDAEGFRLFDLGVLSMSRTGDDIRSFDGKHLSVTDDGRLSAAHDHLGEPLEGENQGFDVNVEGEDTDAISGTSKDATGVRGTSESADGRGVEGENTGVGGTGVEGRGAEGVRGKSNATSNGTGVQGETEPNTGGTGVQGVGDKGVRGQSEVDAGTGVIGENTGADGVGVTGRGDAGVKGLSDSNTGTGVVGENSGTDGIGVEGLGEKGVVGDGSITGVEGTGTVGVLGRNGRTGVKGEGHRFGVRGIARSIDPGDIGVRGQGFTGVRGEASRSDGFGVEGRGGDTGVRGQGFRVGVHGDTSDDTGDEWGFYTPVNSFVGQNLKVEGDLNVTGTKNFSQPVTTHLGERNIVYTAIETPRARTETSGIARLREGRATVDLPDHFDWVTSSSESLVIQVTPYGGDGRLIVTDRSTTRLVIEDPNDSEADYEFAYTVKGVREGFEDKEIIRDGPE